MPPFLSTSFYHEKAETGQPGLLFDEGHYGHFSVDKPMWRCLWWAMNMLRDYLRQISQTAQHGDAREESYYASLAGLLQQYAESVGKTGIRITTLPKKTDAGNPDFRVWDGAHHIVGYLEAKAPTVADLPRVERSEQLQRYRQTFPNLILTNFLEFRLYRNGLLIEHVRIGQPFVLHQLQTAPPLEHAAEFSKLLEKFLAFALPKVSDAQALALELAKRTRFLRDQVILEVLRAEEDAGKTVLSGFYDAFKTYLIGGLTQEAFADLYAQTITYGMFAARTRAANGFNRKLAYDYIPATIGILRDLFKFISWGDVPKPMEWMLDDIAEVLAVTDVKTLLHQYFYEGKGADPIVHFYETFLAAYDPATREKRGVYYTPEPVVAYIVRSLHRILQTHFGRTGGFAADSVTVLDPAGGTLTFLAEAAKVAVTEFAAQYGDGMQGQFIKDHILKNFYAFELMMAPYAVGHLKMAFLLEELGYPLQPDDRFKLYLTNTLEMADLAQIDLPGMRSISEESHCANAVKKAQPILVILGNPPYSGHSANTGDWITNSLKAGVTLVAGVNDDGYYKVDGKPLGEKNPKWLQDDYVKFIRFAQCKIDQAGEGVVGFITNHSYLDNPTFRGMRRSLMQSFDEIYILDLHGNSLKKEQCPDGSKDENVFDIRQGVAIAFFIKKRPSTSLRVTDEKQKCQVFYSELWGLREEQKYPALRQQDIATTPWQPLAPTAELYLFTPRDERLGAAYEKYPKITDIFRHNSVGVVTARDHLTIQWTPEEVWTTVLNFAKLEPELARAAYDLGQDARDWKVTLAQQDLRESGFDWQKIVPMLYRPFDVRYTYYTGKSRGFLCMPRPEIMRHILAGANTTLIFTRSVTASKPFEHIFCSESGMLGRFFPDAACITYFAPLYLYPDTDKKDLFSQTQEPGHKEPNISPGLLATLSQAYQRAPTPEEIFYYVYAVLYANLYRAQYAAFLKTDFPRIPFTQDDGLFRRMGAYGQQLVALHLLKSPELEPPLIKFQGAGESLVEKLQYEQMTQRVRINACQSFEGVPAEVWEYRIGGYQVCQKWLKDRKGRRLTLAEVKQYGKIVTALHKTRAIQAQIDALYADIDFPLDFHPRDLE